MTGGHWQGRFDLGVGSVAPTKARAEVIDFAGIYYYSPYVYVVHAESGIQSEEDLNGKVIGVETGTASETSSTVAWRSMRRACRRFNTNSNRGRCARFPIP